jgi:hypothetical protein
MRALGSSQKFSFVLSLTCGAGRETHKRQRTPWPEGNAQAGIALGAISHTLYYTRSTRTGVTAYTAVREDHRETALRAAPRSFATSGEAAAHTTQAPPVQALAIALALLACFLGLRRGLSNTRDGGQHTTYQGCPHQPKRPTARERTASQPACQLIEGAGSPIFSGHRPPRSSKGGTRQPRLTKAGLVSPALVS